MLPFIFFVILLLGTTINCKVDFCDENQLPLVNPLQFTKELSVWEYAVDSKFKSLHCCARGYLSIEWFKDGRPYPWPGDVSSFIIYPESANQTVYTQTLKTSDAGCYTCRIHNDTMHMIHNSELKVFDSTGYMENPLATYRPPEVSTAVVGQMARLYCEAFVGHIDLPDAASEATWTKEGNDTIDSPRMSVKKVQRENGQIVGEYLMIENVNMTDFGTYICTISNTGDQKIIIKTQLSEWNEWSTPLCLSQRLTLFLVGFILTFVIIVIYNLIRYFMKVDSPLTQLWGKFIELRRVIICKNKTKGNNLLLVYGEDDQQFVDNTFLPLLNQQSQLFVLPQKITKQGKITEDLRQAYRKTEKTVILMSHHLTNKWTRENVSKVLEEIICCNNSPSYCIVLLEPFPDDSSEDNGAYLTRQQNKFILIVWNEEIASRGHPFWTTSFYKVADSTVSGDSSGNTAASQTSGMMRTLSSSVVVNAASSTPFRYSFLRLNRSISSQSSEVPV